MERADSHSEAGRGDSVQDDSAATPLPILLGLPLVIPARVLEIVPKRARRRAAKILAQLLKQLMQAMDESGGQPTESELW